MRKLNWQKASVCLLGIFFLLFLFCPLPTGAELNKGVSYKAVNECPDPGTGKKIALFVLALNRPPADSPPPPEEYCVPVTDTQNTVSFQDLVSAGVFTDDWAGETYTFSVSDGAGCNLDPKIVYWKEGALKDLPQAKWPELSPEMPLSGAQFVVSGKVDYKCIVMAGSEPELQDKKDLNIIYFVTDPKYGPEMEKGWATLVPKGFYGDLAYDQDAIDWEGATEIKVDFGAVKEITVFAEEDGAGTSGEVKIECLDCNKDWSGFKTEKIEGGETKAVIKVDTGAYYEKMGVELPAKFTVKLKGTVGSKKGPRYSFFEFSITINKFNCAEKKTGSDCNKNTQCFFFENICQSKYDKNICKQLPQTLCAPAPGGSKVCTWNEATKQCLEPVATSIAESYGVPDGYKGPLPPCAFSGTCDNINILLNLFIAQGKGIFGLIGVVALGAFVYGGFMMIFSLGSSERVETGRKAMTAAVVGLIISFSAYILVDFVLDALKVSDSFKVIK